MNGEKKKKKKRRRKKSKTVSEFAWLYFYGCQVNLIWMNVCVLRIERKKEKPSNRISVRESRRKRKRKRKKLTIVLQNQENINFIRGPRLLSFDSFVRRKNFFSLLDDVKVNRCQCKSI